MSSDQFVLAKALYDNDAETSDELAFSKGDILTVLEFFPNGLDGWWLCSLRNKVGICPGNRLQLLGHVQCCPPGGGGGHRPSGGSSSRATSPAPPRHHVRQASDPLRSLPTAMAAAASDSTMGRPFDASTPRDPRRRLSNSNKVIIPQKVGEVYLYDIPDTTRPPVSLTDSFSTVTGHPAPHGPAGTAMFMSSATYDTPRPHRTMTMSTSSNTSLDVYDVPKTSSQFGGGGDESYDVPRSYHSSRRSSTASDFPCSASAAPQPPPPPPSLTLQDYDVPRNQQHGCGGTPHDTYDVPTASQQQAFGCGEGTYDVPLSSLLQTTMTTSRGSRCGSPHSSTSTSTSSSSPAQSADPSLTPSLSLSSLLGGAGGDGGGGGGSSSNRSSLEKPHELYDIPRSVQTAASGGTQSVEGVYDVPPQVTRDQSPFEMAATCDDDTEVLAMSSDAACPSAAAVAATATTPMEGKEIPLELDAAVEVSVKLQQEVQSAINKLFTLLGSSKSKDSSGGSRSYDLQMCCSRVRASLQEFLDFANGALVNSSKCADQAVCVRLNKLLRPLQDANVIVRQTCQSIEQNKLGSSSWTSSSPPSATSVDHGPPDDKDRLVACARTVIEDVRQVSCFIQGNATLIFKRTTTSTSTTCSSDASANKVAPTSLPPKTRERPLPPTPGVRGGGGNKDKNGTKNDENLYENDGGTWVVDDYDYVNLESKESYHRKNEEIKASLPKELHKSFDNLLKESLVQVDTSVKCADGDFVADPPGQHRGRSTGVRTIRLDVNDRHVIGFYAGQLDEHSNYLNNAIQAFLLTVDTNQPPKVFVDHGKFVILGAHKLVFIGDTIHRNVFQADVRTRVQRCADDLCETLKTMVQRVKSAAQQFPSVIAVQEMVDSVVDVSQAACELKTVVSNLAKM